MAAPSPFFAHLAVVRSLKGEPLVTYPYGHASYPVVERSYTRPSVETLRAFLSAEPDAVRFAGLKLIGISILSDDRVQREVLYRWEKLPGLPILRYALDGETNLPVTITTQLVEKPGSPYAQVEGSDIIYEPIADTHGHKITTSISLGVGPTFSTTERRLLQYTYPSLLFAATGSLVESRSGAPRFKVNYTKRSSFTQLVPAQVVVQYGPAASLTMPAEGDYYSGKLNDLLYEGALFDVNQQNVLNDAFTLTATTGTKNASLPYIVDTYTAPVSVPTATDYAALVAGGSFLLIAASKPVNWKYGLQRLEKISVPAR